MNALDSRNKYPVTPEQDSEASRESVWSGLTKLSESETWDEHLEKANRLTNLTNELTPRETEGFLSYGDKARNNKKIFFRDLAQQEKLEREFNSELSHVEDLELLAEADDPRIEKTSVKYQDKDIPVYILKDYPLKFLAHIINYREGDNVSGIGIKTSDSLVNNPRKWLEPYRPPKPDEVTADGWIKDKANAISNTLSTSYANGTLRSFDNDLAHGNGRRSNSIIYGFDHVRPMSVFDTKTKDAITENYVEQGDYRNRTIRNLVSNIGELDTNKNKAGNWYNEVAMFRYDENGKPLKPSFMVTDNLRVLLDTESLPEEETRWAGENQYQRKKDDFYMNRIKQHAAEHEIPIILLDRKTYGDKSERAKRSADEYIAEHWSDVLAAGMDPKFVKSKLPAEDVWQNYDNLKKYMPDLDIEKEFDSLVGERVKNALKENGDMPTDAEEDQAYAKVVYNALFGMDAYEYLERGGDEEYLLEMSRQTGDEEIIRQAQRLLEQPR